MKSETKSFEKFSEGFSKNLSAFKGFLKRQTSEFSTELKSHASECIKPKGKYLRPLLVFSTAINKKHDNGSLLNRATVVELIHLASLIHDDVIDNANLRRSSETIFKKFGAKTAILLGDAIFAHAMLISLKENEERIWRESISTVRNLCEGEIRQSLAKDRNIDRKKYIEIVEGKTASLFKLACLFGSTLEKDESWVKASTKAGNLLGIAYQIYDDICDWTMTEESSGKTLGTDLLSEKHTLPIIVLLEKLPRKESKMLAKELKEQNPKEIFKKMIEMDVMSTCIEIYNSYISDARESIKEFPDKNSKLLEFCTVMENFFMNK